MPKSSTTYILGKESKTIIYKSIKLKITWPKICRKIRNGLTMKGNFKRSK